LGDCCEIVSGATPSTSEAVNWGGDICWATPKDLSALSGTYISDTPRKLTRLGLDRCAATVLPPQSVLFSSRAPIGHVAINTVPMATNQGFKSFVPDVTRVEPKYLYWWLRANRSRLEALGNGATFKEVSKAVVSRIEIELPSLVEQRRIAAILDCADALRTKRRAALAQLDALAESIFIDMFGDPATNLKGWPVVPLSDCAERIQIGPFGSLLHEGDYVRGGVPLVNPKHIQDRTIVVDADESVSPAKLATLDAYVLREGDVVLGRRGEMGRCAVVRRQDAGLLCGTGSVFIRPDPRVLTAVYTAAWLSTPSTRRQLERMALGITLPNLNRSIVASLLVPVPPLPLQSKFCRMSDRRNALATSMRGSSRSVDALIASIQHSELAAR
jgi:type I restriction enzyme S subunit